MPRSSETTDMEEKRRRGPVPLASRLVPWVVHLRESYEAGHDIHEIREECIKLGMPSRSLIAVQKTVQRMGLHRPPDWRRSAVNISTAPSRPEWEDFFRESYTQGMDIHAIMIQLVKRGMPTTTTVDYLRRLASTRGWRRPEGFWATNRRNQVLGRKMSDRHHESIVAHEPPRPVFRPVLYPEAKPPPPPLSLELPEPGPDGKIAARYEAIKAWADLRNYPFDGSNVEQLNRDLRSKLPPLIILE